MFATLFLLVLLGGTDVPERPRADRLDQAIAAFEAEELGGAAGDPSHLRVAWAQLDGDGPPEALVLHEGPMWCGTGGCTLTVWRESAGGEFRFVSRSSLCREDIRLATSTHYGWTDLVVRVSGGGQEPSYRVLRHNGNAYALNPSIEPVYEGAPEDLIALEFAAGD